MTKRKILIDTEVTNKINEKIYNEYSKYINDVKNNGEVNGTSQ